MSYTQSPFPLIQGTKAHSSALKAVGLASTPGEQVALSSGVSADQTLIEAANVMGKSSTPNVIDYTVHMDRVNITPASESLKKSRLENKAKFKEQRKKDFKKEKKERQKKWAEFKGNIQQKYWDWKGKRYRSEYGDPDTPYDIPGLV